MEVIRRVYGKVQSEEAVPEMRAAMARTSSRLETEELSENLGGRTHLGG